MTVIPKWSELAPIGNSFIAKVSVVWPFVGYFILFNAKIVFALELYCTEQSCFGKGLLSNLYYLYFGLTFLGLGSLVFMIFCSPLIKKFSDEHIFSLSLQSVVTRAQLRNFQAITEALSNQPDSTTDFIESGWSDPREAERKKLDILFAVYTALDRSRAFARLCVILLYGLGFLLISVPSARTFYKVLLSLS